VAKPIPDRIAKYRILEETSRTNYAVVYEAIDTTVGGVVVLKVLWPHLATQKALVDRFMKEGRSAAKLNHPNIVAIYEVGATHGFHYIAMQYIEGKSLHRSALKTCDEQD